MLKSMMTKNDIRKSILATRESSDIDTLSQKSSLICEKFIELFSNYNSFLLYSPIRNEVDVSTITHTLHKLGKLIYLPRVIGSEMCFNQYERGVITYDEYGIICGSGAKLTDEVIDVAVIPCVACDSNFGRIGYGKGYYDKFLSDSKVILKVAVAYDFQMVDTTYFDDNDITMDIIITESTTFRRNK